MASVLCSFHIEKKTRILTVLMGMTWRVGWELVAGCDTCPGAHLPGHTHLGLIQDPIS